jgi:hypothetical protein
VQQLNPRPPFPFDNKLNVSITILQFCAYQFECILPFLIKILHLVDSK